MEEKLEVVEVKPNDNFLCCDDENSIKEIIGDVNDEFIAILAVDDEPVTSDNNILTIEDDISDDHKDSFDEVKIVNINESKGLFVLRKDGAKFILTNKNILDNVKLYENNIRITDYYNINSAIISCLVYGVFVNKLKTQSIDNNIAYADMVIKRLRAKGGNKAYIFVKDLLYNVFLDPSKKYSLESIKLNNGNFSNAHRDYLVDLITSIKNNPRDLSFFSEDKLTFL